MILVTGAAGKSGAAIVKALSDRGRVVRALVRREAQRAVVQEAGAAESVVADMTSAREVREAMEGVRGIYLIAPNMHPGEEAIGRHVIDAARGAGVSHLVYHSVLHPQTEAMAHHWQKLRVEEAIFASGLAYTILQPAIYMQNMLAGWERIRNEGVYSIPYPAATRLSMVDMRDVAQVAAAVIGEPRHYAAIYELSGTKPLAQSEVAAVLEQGLQRSVVAEEMPLDEWERAARERGLSGYTLDTLLQMFRYYARFGFEGNPNVLEYLLGRPATSLAAFVERERGPEA